MRYRFHTKKLRDLYHHEKGIKKYPAGVVDAFFEVMSIIEAATDIRDIRNLKSLHFEKLAGKRKEQSSVRLNDQFRLTLIVTQDEYGNYLLLLAIEDYHK